MTYCGPLGEGSSALIEYLEAVPGVHPIQPGANPATWMLVGCQEFTNRKPPNNTLSHRFHYQFSAAVLQTRILGHPLKNRKHCLMALPRSVVIPS